MANQSTPLETDLYTRVNAGLLDTRKTMYSTAAFMSLFGKAPGRTIFSKDRSAVKIDILHGNREAAQLVKRGEVGQRTDNPRPVGDNFETIVRTFPLIEEETPISADQLELRRPGESSESQLSRKRRMQLMARDHHDEQVRLCHRRVEGLASDAYRTGKHVAVEGTVDPNYIYDTGRNVDNTFTPVTKWNEVGADIIGDIEDLCEKVLENGFLDPDFILMGDRALDALIRNAEVKERADIRRYQLVQIGTGLTTPAVFSEMVANGAKHWGRIVIAGKYDLEIFSYNARWVPPGVGVSTKYMPEDEVIVANSGARCDLYLGPPELLPSTPTRDSLYRETFGFDPKSAPMPANISKTRPLPMSGFYFSAYYSENEKVVTLRTQVAPILITTHTDAIARGHTLLA